MNRIHIMIDDTKKLNLGVSKSAFVGFEYNSKILRELQNLGTRYYHSDTKLWEIPILSLPNLCARLSEFEIEITGKFQSESIPSLYKTKPFNHQIEGVAYGLSHDCFILGDDQGLGKSKQIIDIAVERKRRGQTEKCLIICGVNSLKYNWQEEIELHSDEANWVLGSRYKRDGTIREGGGKEKLEDLNNLPPAFFLIINIEALRGLYYREAPVGRQKKGKLRFPIAEKINELSSRKIINMVAFDECHKAKNSQSLQGEALMCINKAKFRIPISGTILMNSPLDLYTPLAWIGIEEHSYYSYTKHYCRYGGYNNQDLVGFKNLNELQNIMQSVMLRRMKSDVLDLPEKIYQVEYLEMSNKQTKIYEEVVSNLRLLVDKIRKSINPLSEMIRLRQATGWTGIISSTVKESVKMERLVELTKDLTDMGYKVIVFSQWEAITSVAREHLAEYNPAYITGSISAEDRMSQLAMFQEDEDCKAIIGTIGAMGTGYTLTAGSYVIFLDEPWNNALKEQAIDRAHRIGTTGTVNIITLICKDTLDEVIHNIIYKKKLMSDLLVDSKMSDSTPDYILRMLLSELNK